MTIENLIRKAGEHGFKQSDIVTAARVYHGEPNIFRLTPIQIEDLDRRMSMRIAKRKQEREKNEKSEESRR